MTCPTCGLYIFPGQSHVCQPYNPAPIPPYAPSAAPGGVPIQQQPATTWNWSTWVDNAALQRIAGALERLADAAERREARELGVEAHG